MNILIDIGHPAHVHLYRNLYRELSGNGHRVMVTVKNLLPATMLLDKYNIPYHVQGKKLDTMHGKLIRQMVFDWKMIRFINRYKIKLLIGSSITIAHASRLTSAWSVVFDDDDDEVQPMFVRFAHPFAHLLVSPESVRHRRKKKGTVYFNGFHELAYLHPSRFTPDAGVLDGLGLKEGERFFVMRFNAFKAHHDTDARGLSAGQKAELIRMLEPEGRIFITTERETEPEFQKYRVTVSPEDMHSLLFYATLFIGDSQTMTSEAAVLGTPSLRCNTFAGRISYLEDLEHNYQLTYGFLPEQFDRLKEKVAELLAMPNLSATWQERRSKMLEDKVDTTSFMVDLIENFITNLTPANT